MILNLKNLPSDSVTLFGAKVSALNRLIHNNINVPEGYVLSNEVYFSYLTFNKFCYSPAQYLSYNDEIQDFLISGEFPSDVKVTLKDIYYTLMDSGKSSIAVRSSAVCEDNKKYSMAGVFESFLNIKSYDELEYSIKKCYASLFSDKALSLMLRNNIKLENIGMSVIVQRFIEGDVSGVMFTTDTISMDKNIVVINAVEGQCSGFVDGMKKSSFYRVDKYNRQVVDKNISTAGEVLTDRKVIEQPEDIFFLKLDEIFNSLQEVVEGLDMKIRERKEKHSKYNNARPPEYLGKAPDMSNTANKNDVMVGLLKGVSGLERKVTGRVRVINDSARSSEIKEECILVLKHGHGCYFLPVMNRIKGLIYDEGSPFDHPGILAREFGIPSIYKTGNATRVLKDGDLVELDGIAGVVRIINQVLL